MLRDDEQELARETLAQFDRLAVALPPDPHEAITQVVRSLNRLRDRVIARQRREGDGREALAAINAVLSLAVGAQFPVAGNHPERLEKARDALRDLVER